MGILGVWLRRAEVVVVGMRDSLVEVAFHAEWLRRRCHRSPQVLEEELWIGIVGGRSRRDACSRVQLWDMVLSEGRGLCRSILASGAVSCV